MIYLQVSKAFNKHVKELLKDRVEFLNFIIKHERRHLLIQRLTNQIKKARSKGRRCSNDDIDRVVKDFVLMFSKAAVTKADQDVNKKENEWLDQLKRVEEPDLEGFNVKTTRLETPD